jgi:hypothetical protein
MARYNERMKFLHAEFMYKPRPTEAVQRRTFDKNLRSRLNALSQHDTLLLICNHESTLTSLQPVLDAYPALQKCHVFTNPQPRAVQSDTPARCDWESPERWTQMDMSDRWARILCALRYAEADGEREGYLVMPAHEAVFGEGLLEALAAFAHEQHTRTGLPHAVSPAPARSDDASPALLLLDAAFDRAPFDDVCEQGQGFWGKMGMIPLALCAKLAREVDTDVWEDDLEIDWAMVEIGGATACIRLPRQQYLLDYGDINIASVRQIIERHLHYSLRIPGEQASALLAAPSQHSRARARGNAAYARAVQMADALIAECDAEMRTRVAKWGCSWVDWGAYRYVARPRDPAVEVWKHG